jgi:hypothetical protein
MWEKISPADIDRVRHALEVARTEALSRHAEERNSLEARQASELQRLDGERAEVEILDALIANLIETYRIGTDSAVDETAPINLEAFRKFAS